MSDLVILTTPRLIVTMWGQYDAYLLHGLHSTEVMSRYVGGAPWSLEKAQARLTAFFAEQANDGVTKYKVTAKDDGRFVGRAGFSRYKGDGEGETFELGYSIREQEWGKGYASELAEALATWFFERKLAPRFIAFAHPDNLASQRVMAKIGMRSRMPVMVGELSCPAFEMSADMRSA